MKELRHKYHTSKACSLRHVPQMELSNSVKAGARFYHRGRLPWLRTFMVSLSRSRYLAQFASVAFTSFPVYRSAVFLLDMHLRNAVKWAREAWTTSKNNTLYRLVLKNKQVLFSNKMTSIFAVVILQHETTLNIDRSRTATFANDTCCLIHPHTISSTYPSGLHTTWEQFNVAVTLKTHSGSTRFEPVSHVTRYNGRRIKVHNMHFTLHAPIRFLTAAYAGEQEMGDVKQHGGGGGGLTTDILL
jgi:hypothetical protein